MESKNIAPREAPVDLLAESEGRLAVIVFPNSSSKNLPLALTLAQQGDFRQTSIGGQLMNMTSFDKNERGAKLAVSLLRCVGSWKGAIIYSNGQIIESWYEISDVLSCYLQSCLCVDYRAHCFSVIDDPAFRLKETLGMTISFQEGPVPTQQVAVDRYTFPCEKIFHSTNLNPEHPSSYQDQIQASAVKRLCHICPRFDSSNFRKIGSKTYEIEI